jgi:hypothetical protein
MQVFPMAPSPTITSLIPIGSSDIKKIINIGLLIYIRSTYIKQLIDK